MMKIKKGPSIPDYMHYGKGKKYIGSNTQGEMVNSRGKEDEIFSSNHTPALEDKQNNSHKEPRWRVDQR